MLDKAAQTFREKGLGELYTESVDVSEADRLYAFVDHVKRDLGRIDIWVNNTATTVVKSIMELDLDTWNFIMRTNLNSYFIGTQAAGRVMKEQGGGVILNVASFGGLMPPMYRSAYCTSKYGINGLTRMSAAEFAPFGIRVNAVAPGTINTAMQAIDKLRDTSSSHERVSIVEVMGRHAGYIALWCAIANGADDILLPEKYDFNEQRIIDNIIDNRKRGKTHHIIVNAEGIGHSTSMARRIEAATGIETRASILGYMQRGGSPTCKDRVYASIMGCYAADILAEGKTNRVVGYRNGEFQDFDIEEALNMKKDIPEYQYKISRIL